MDRNNVVNDSIFIFVVVQTILLFDFDFDDMLA